MKVRVWLGSRRRTHRPGSEADNPQNKDRDGASETVSSNLSPEPTDAKARLLGAGFCRQREHPLGFYEPSLASTSVIRGATACRV